MITSILLIMGIFLMIYGISIGFKLIHIVEDPQFKIQLWSTFVLTCFFLLGYVVFFYNVVSPNVNFVFTDTLIAAVFCFGAVYVILMLTIVYDVFNKKHRKRIF